MKKRMPKAKTVAAYTLQAIRGPDEEGRFYFRLLQAEGRTRHGRALGWKTKDEADAVLADVVAGLETQQPSPPSRSATTEVLLRAWLAKMEERSDLKSSSLLHYRGTVSRLVGEIGAIQVEKLGFDDLESYCNRRMKAGNSPRTVVGDFRALRSAWKWARRQGYVSDFPFDLPKVKIEPGAYRINHRTPTPDEVQATVSCMAGWQRDCAMLLWGTGARPIAIRTLTWDRADVARGLVTFHDKTGIRTVPLGAVALDVLRRLYAEQGKPVAGKVLGTEAASMSLLQKAIRDGCRKASVAPWTPYALRRLAVDTLARSGVDVASAASITGHSPEVMLRVYRTVTEQDQRLALSLAGLGTVKKNERKVIPFPGGS